MIIKSISLPCICTSDQSSQKSNKMQSWKSSISGCCIKCLLSLFFLFLFQKTDLDANLYPWVSWKSVYHPLSARNLKEQSNSFRNGYKTGRVRRGGCIPPWKMLHFRRIQKREYPHEKGPMHCAKALWSSGDISQHSLDSENLRKQCWNDRLLRTSDWHL